MSDLDKTLMVINGPGDERARVISAQTITAVAAVLAVLGRFLARHVSKTKLGWDDWLILPALAFAMVWYAMMWWYLSIGLGMYIGEVTYRKLRVGFLAVFITSYLYAFCIGLAKLSILFLYSRAFTPERWVRTYIRVMAIITVLWTLAITIIVSLQCQPLNRFWNLNIEGKCNVHIKTFYLATGIVDIVTDVAMFALPLVLCARLKLSLVNKILLCFVFASGFFVTLISAIRVKTILNLDLESPQAANITWTQWPIGMISGTDANMAVVSACLPCLRPLIAKAIPKAFVPSRLRKKPTSDPKSPIVDKFSRPKPSRTSTASSQWLTLLDEEENSFADPYDLKCKTDMSDYQRSDTLAKDVELAVPPPTAAYSRREGSVPSWSTEVFASLEHYDLDQKSLGIER